MNMREEGKRRGKTGKWGPACCRTIWNLFKSFIFIL